MPSDPVRIIGHEPEGRQADVNAAYALLVDIVTAALNVVVTNVPLPVVEQTNPLPVAEQTVPLPVAEQTNPLPVENITGGAAVGVANPLAIENITGGAVVGAANPLAIENILGGAVIAPANPVPVAEQTNPLPVEEQANVTEITVTPTISAAAIYAAGDALGGLMEFPNAARAAGGSGTITKVVIIDDDQELAPIDIVFFDRTFGATADNAPFDPSDADMQNNIGYVDVAATDYADFNDNSVATKASGLRMPFDFVLNGTSLFAQMVVRDTPTYTATDDLTIKLTIRQD